MAAFEMRRERLVGLALLKRYALCEFEISKENIINRFANTKKRNLDFVI